MINIVFNNPFRILGVYSNSSKKEITANATKLKAFLKVNKEMSFPSELSEKMGALKRSSDSVETSLAKINLPEDKIIYSLFWFVNASALDKAALSNLEAGNEDKAIEIWEKKECFSSIINLAVLSLVNDDLDTYIAKVTNLIHDDNLRGEFVSCICDETFDISEDDLAHKMIDALLQEVKTSEVYDKFVSYGSSADDDEYLKDKAVEEPVTLINSEIAKAKSVKREDAKANYLAGFALINATKAPLNRIKEVIGEDDPAYERVADNLAQTILQCGINYYNNSDDDDDVEKALYIQKAAQKIAVGLIAKDRCKQNVAILEKKKEEAGIKDDLEVVANELKSFQGKYNSIANAKALVDNCKPHLLNISAALGSTNDLYIKISSAVANNALGMIISVVNDAQSGTPNLTTLKSTISSAMSLMNQIGTLAMTAQERSHFTTNKTTLANMQAQISLASLSSGYSGSSYSGGGYSSSTSSSSGGSDTNWGCIIAGAIGFIIFIIICCNS